MFFKLLSNIIFLYKRLTTPQDYTIISEELEYHIDNSIKYKIDDVFWENESKDWDGILSEYHVCAHRLSCRNTVVPENVTKLILRVKYFYNGRVYKAITNDINFIPGFDGDNMVFNIPLRHVWIVDHDDKPQVDITEKVKRYAGPRNDFHNQSVSLEDFLYYDRETLDEKFPKISLINSLGMKKIVFTTHDNISDLRII